MKYAIVNGKKVEATSRAIGKCPHCGSEVRGHAGKIIVNHWHHVVKDCDPWRKPETQWHLDWKGHFPKANQEVQYCDNKGEKHIADVKTPRNLVLEFQNSSISLDEIESRNNFYKDIIWIVNLKKQKNQFILEGQLPDAFSDYYERNILMPISEIRRSPIFDSMAVIQKSKIINKYKEEVSNHFVYRWKYERHYWSRNPKPVFLDFCDGDLWLLKQTHDSAIQTVIKYKKEFIIEKLMKHWSPPQIVHTN